jgi:hypothetical protein
MPNQTIKELQTAALETQQAEQKKIDAIANTSRIKAETEAIEAIKPILDPLIPIAFLDELNFHYGIRKETTIACGYLNYRGVTIEIALDGERHFKVTRGSVIGTVERKDLENYILTHELIQIDRSLKTFEIGLKGSISVDAMSSTAAIDFVRALINSSLNGDIQYWDSNRIAPPIAVSPIFLNPAPATSVKSLTNVIANEVLDNLASENSIPANQRLF